MSSQKSGCSSDKSRSDRTVTGLGDTSRSGSKDPGVGKQKIKK